MFCPSILAPSTLLLTAASLIWPPAPPLPNETSTENKSHAIVETRTDVGWVGASQTFHVIVLLTPDAGWHVYWKNPGASGAPTEIEIDAPDGFIVGEPIFPRPMTFHDEEGETFGYDEPVAIFIPVTAPETLHDGQVEFNLTTSWLACKKICVMGEQQNTLHISTNALQQGPLHRDMQLSRWFSSLPRPLDDLEKGKSVVSGGVLHITGESEMRPIQFVGVERTGIRFGALQELSREGDTFRLSVPIKLDLSLKQQIDGSTLVVEGLLLLGSKNDDPSYVVHLRVNFTNN